MSAPSSSHQIVGRLWRALRALGASPTAAEVETWGLAVHSALAATSREFHSHEHVLELAEGAEPLDVIAALYHDVVYVQVDREMPVALAAILAPMLEPESGPLGESRASPCDRAKLHDRHLTASWRVRDAATSDPFARDVLAVFGRAPGDVLGPMCGLNELASALAAAGQLGRLLGRDAIVAIAARIEATIPFRTDPGEVLAARLRAMGGAEETVVRDVRDAIAFANRDVENFADADPARFLSNTWKLLPETNPSLNVPSRYTVGDYRVALLKMESFLEKLPAERVFHAWGGAPDATEHRRLIAAAQKNIAIGVRYLRAKLLAIGLVEAICMATGGDLPLQYVLGTFGRTGGTALESFLAPPKSGPEPDPTLHRLLLGGRATPSSFDIAPSPLASHLLGALGESAIERGVADAREWWRGDLTPVQFLARQDADLVVSLAKAAAELAETRREGLLELAAVLGRARSSAAPPLPVAFACA